MTTYYISPTGNDTTGNGSSGTPWLTISKAHTSASSGDTIICKNGTYTWASQTFTKSLIIQAETNGLAIFDAALANVTWTFNTSITVAMTGLYFKNSRPSGVGVFVVAAAAAGTNLNWQQCQFKNLGTIAGTFNAVFLLSQASSPTNCTFVFNTCVFNDCTKISGTTLNYFFFVQGLNTGMSLTITSCVFYFVTGGSSILTQIFNAQQAGNPATFVCKNNIFYNATGTSIAWKGSFTPTSSTITNNCYYTNLTSLPTDAAGVTSDPLFVDVANDNFALRPTSPCLNTGTLV